MFYVLAILWHERQRFLPGVLAVGFSALLIVLQCGLLLGLFSVTSIPVDEAAADIWVCAPRVLGVDLGRPIPDRFLARLASQDGVEQPEAYIQGFTYWTKAEGGSQLCMVVGARLGDDTLGLTRVLSKDLRERLSEPGTVVIDESDMSRLGIHKVGDTGEIFGKRVRVIGVVEGMRSFAGPYVFCSLRSARPLLSMSAGETTYLLARCRDSAQAENIVKDLRRFDDMTVYTKDDFSLRTRMHWLTTTKAGIALGYTAVLGLLVGAVVTSQTLYSATASSFREYATLEALGIPRWRIGLLILTQAFWIGVFGIALAFPCIMGLAEVAELMSVHVMTPAWLMLGAFGVTLSMALFAGLAALRSLRFIDVYSLLR
jgi:putative ABC transport system permease protein